MTTKQSRRGRAKVVRDALRVSDTPEEKADWVESWTLLNRDGNTSFSELRSAMKIGGSADAYSESDCSEQQEHGDDISGAGTQDSNLYEASAEDTFAEISDRVLSCGESAYPFDVSSERIALRRGTFASAYTFLLLLSKYGRAAGPRDTDGAKLFEDICAHAVSCFLGREEGFASAEVFGFPRGARPGGFARALDSLCQQMGEGRGSRKRPTLSHQKDAGLDVVGWKSFRDRRQGKLIIFGQCATGGNWKDKRKELKPTEDWCNLWMEDRPLVSPLPAFFVPHRVGRDDWTDTCILGGLLFDRCRIAALTNVLPALTVRRMARWSRHATEHGRGS